MKDWVFEGAFDELRRDVGADGRFICADGLVVPFRYYLLKLGSDKLVKQARESHDSGMSPISLDGQTMLRILSFICDDDYSNDNYAVESKMMRSTSFTSNLNNVVSFQPDVDSLTTNFSKLKVSQGSSVPRVFRQALANMQLFIAATWLNIDELVQESERRFEGIIRGSSLEKGFTKFIEAVSELAGPAQQLFDLLVQECAARAHDLCKDPDFLLAVENSGVLGRMLLVEIVDQSDRRITDADGSGNQLLLTDASNQDLVLIDDSKVTDLESQINDLQHRISAQTQTLQITQEDNKQKNVKLDDMRALIADKDSQMAVMRKEVNNKIRAIDKLEDDLDERESQLRIVNGKVVHLREQNQQLTVGINNNRLGRPNVVHQLTGERDEARRRVRELELELSNMRAELDRSKAQGQGRRQVEGFSTTASVVRQINGGRDLPIPSGYQRKQASDMSAILNPRGRELPKDAVINGKGVPTFIHKRFDATRKRFEAAGVAGDDEERPQSPHTPKTQNAPLPQQRLIPDLDSPSAATQTHDAQEAITINGAPRDIDIIVGRKDKEIASLKDKIETLIEAARREKARSANAAQTNERDKNNTTAQKDREIAGLKAQITSLSGQLRHPRPAPAAAVQSVAPGSNAVIAGKDGEIAAKNKRIDFLQRQLADARGDPRDGCARCKTMLDLHAEAIADHKACNDCLRDFNGQFRYDRSRRNEEVLKLVCANCMAEKMRWSLPGTQQRR